MVFEQVYNNYAREASLADDAMFLKEILHGGGGAAAPPPHLHTRRLYHGF